jgi:hypothetical protein
VLARRERADASGVQRPRLYGVSVAVPDENAWHRTHILNSPTGYEQRAVLCASITSKAVTDCKLPPLARHDSQLPLQSRSLPYGGKVTPTRRAERAGQVGHVLHPAQSTHTAYRRMRGSTAIQPHAGAGPPQTRNHQPFRDPSPPEAS